ncbi:MAG: Txe/YoeB family addiction module toxin [Saprospirales bacterium]|nr:MAG: Txe/YoeB family addiction module toxin [Saprospirales bacterium]
MTIEFTKSAWEDFEFWIENDKDIVKKIKDLLRAIKAHPFKGPGKPEPLKYGLNGYWSRRINHEHRLVYKVRSATTYSPTSKKAWKKAKPCVRVFLNRLLRANC